MSKNIIIVGYPKSGTTWLTRLVADLLQCPLKGNWGFDDPGQVIIEGLDRQSDFACYKSHHSYNEIFKTSEQPVYKIIYLIRDPRDIVISGANFFGHAYNVTGLKAIQSKIINSFKANTKNKKQMIQAVLEGNASINPWCRLSWQEHYQPYHNQEILFIRYEKLVVQAKAECHKILDYLSIQKPEIEILKAIEQQSFKNKKGRATENEDRFEYLLLRKGSYGYWKKEFSEEEKKMFIDSFKQDKLFKKFYL